MSYQTEFLEIFKQYKQKQREANDRRRSKEYLNNLYLERQEQDEDDLADMKLKLAQMPYSVCIKCNEILKVGNQLETICEKCK